MEDTKTWVLQKLLKEREFTCTEIELRCKELIQEWCTEKEKSRMDEKNNWIKDVLAVEKMGPSTDWMYVCRKEMQKMREEWLKEDRLRRTQENKTWRMEEEKRTEEERRRSDEQMALEERLKKMEKRVCEFENARERMEKERVKEREEMKEYNKRIKADREKERDEMKQYKEMMQRERDKEREEMKEYEAMIQREREKEREEMKHYMEKLQESQRALEKERGLMHEEREKIEEEWNKEKKWMAQCIEEEEAEKLELKRAMWWMRTERNQEKQQLKIYQQRDEVRMREMEHLRREVVEKLDAQKEKLENVFKEREMRMQKWERKQEMISEDHQRGWKTARLELQNAKRIKEESERRTKELARDMSLQYLELEAKLLTIVKEFAEAMGDIEGCSRRRLKEIELRVKEMLEQDRRMTANNKSAGSTGKERNEQRKKWSLFSRRFKK